MAVPFEGMQIIDPGASVKFVSIYLPSPNNTYEAAAALSDHIEEAGILNSFHIQAQGNGMEQIDTGKYRFSGRVFIYHEGFLSAEQKGDLHRLYAAKNMDLETRGEPYRIFKNLQRTTETQKPVSP